MKYLYCRINAAGNDGVGLGFHACMGCVTTIASARSTQNKRDLTQSHTCNIFADRRRKARTAMYNIVYQSIHNHRGVLSLFENDLLH